MDLSNVNISARSKQIFVSALKNKEVQIIRK